MIFLADMPPPVHGMSLVNSYVYDACENECEVKIIDTSPWKKISNPKFFWLGKFLSFFGAFFRFFCLLRSEKVLYRPINGGVGQVYDLAYLFVARVFKCNIYLHHHSFNYINRKSVLFNILLLVVGGRATHITLGNEMKYKLQVLYGKRIGEIVVVSNSAFYKGAGQEIRRFSSPVVIGHMANLSIEKGLAEFAEVCRSLYMKKFEFSALIAGPANDEHAKEVLECLLEDVPCVQYVGPVYGAEKFEYFKKLDCFVFQSSYMNEAEPLVLYEAAEHGVKLYVSRRGCMESVSLRLKGNCYGEYGSSKLVADDIIKDLEAGVLNYMSRLERSKNFEEVVRIAKHDFDEIIREMCA